MKAMSLPSVLTILEQFLQVDQMIIQLNFEILKQKLKLLIY